MNSETLALQYKKAQVYMRNRPRRVTFSLHHRLYRSVHLAEDLKILDRERYNPAGPLESRVWGERLDQDQLEYYMTLVEDNFWPMIFSNKWSRYSSIRVTEGALLDSLLVTYYTLVTEGKLLTYTTEIFQENVCTKPRRKRKRAVAGKEEAIKITFTYFSRTADELTKAVSANQGVTITTTEIRQQNPAFIPNILSDALQNTLPCSVATCPEWVKQSSVSDDAQSKFGDLLMPENPPNSPTPAQNQVTLKYTHSEMRRRCEPQRLGGSDDVATEYSHLPLVLRTWHNGLASRPVEGIAVVGQKLKQPCSVFPTTNGPPSQQIVFLGNRQQDVHLVPTPRGARNRSSRPVHLPSLSLHAPEEGRPAQIGQLDTSRRNSLQIKLLESNHLHDVDICKTAFIPRKVQFINVVSPLTSPVGEGPSPTQTVFDTDKLRINSSLEKVRPEVVRQPVRRLNPHLPPQTSKGPALLSGKNYVMQRYLHESTPVPNEFTAKMPDKSDDQSSSYPQSSKFSEITEVPPSISSYYRHRIPADFADHCLAATGCFVVRKEYVTSSRLYKTVTSLTISKIPEGGYQRWKYEK